ncbi:MAG: hypothetical protein H6Q17_33 [Bacteroidetes bacterium]|nr:hypothetical protein [Bacteroidota bacterium]
MLSNQQLSLQLNNHYIIMGQKIQTTLNSWEQIFQINNRFLLPFIFRGHSQSDMILETSIERTIKKFISPPLNDKYTTQERWMLFEFSRRYHLYSNLSNLIKEEDKFEWLAIMQHYGAPTRLLDFTYSFFIASFFAIVDSTCEASIWALNRHILRDNLADNYLSYKKREILKDEINLKHIAFANQFIARKFDPNYEYPSTIIPLEPKLLNERLSKQQGLFLMPTNPEKSFSDNLKSALKTDKIDLQEITIEKLIELSLKRDQEPIEIIKFILPKHTHKEIIRRLTGMNITYETLFPGLDGLAKSLTQTQIERD